MVKSIVVVFMVLIKLSAYNSQLLINPITNMVFRLKQKNPIGGAGKLNSDEDEATFHIYRMTCKPTAVHKKYLIESFTSSCLSPKTSGGESSIQTSLHRAEVAP